MKTWGLEGTRGGVKPPAPDKSSTGWILSKVNQMLFD